MTSNFIDRDDLIGVVAIASYGLTESTRAKLLKVAETTNAVAVGWFHCDGVDCPARQARRHNQRFQTAFDREMGLRFGRPVNEDIDPFDTTAKLVEPFVVRVRDKGVARG